MAGRRLAGRVVVCAALVPPLSDPTRCFGVIPYIDIRSFHIGPVEIQPFGLLVCIGIVASYFAAAHRARQVGLDVGVIRQIVRLSAVFGIGGAHLVHLFFYHPEELAADPWVLLRFWSGMSSYGGFVFAITACAIYLVRRRVNLRAYADVAMYGFFAAWFFGRLGCSIAHDHPGRLSDFFLAVKFPGGARHDLGLYEFMLCWLWIPFIHWMGRKKKIDDPPAGSIFAAMLVAYSVPRFFLDFLRATDLPYHDARYLGLTPAQYACIIFTVLGVWFFACLRARRHPP